VHVLGINAFGHDAAAVLLHRGRVVYAASQERFDRKKHSAAFPAEAMQAALAHAGIGPADLGAIAFPWSKGMGRLAKVFHMLRSLPRSMAYLREPPDTQLPDRRSYLRNMVSIEAHLRRAGFDAPVHRVPHHLAHAASAALALPSEDACVLTADGMGEWTTAATWHVRAGRPARLQHAAYPHSPGKAYSAVTAWLGFRPESGEGKTMGLAAYGNLEAPQAQFARALMQPHDERLVRVDVRKFGFPWGEARLYGNAFLDALGPAREKDEALREGDAHVARGIQDAVEAFALQAARRCLDTTHTAHITLAGGLFLNCSMNGRLTRDLDADVYPFPVAGDAGAAWGAAAATARKLGETRIEPLGTLQLGTPIDQDECAALAQSLNGTQYEDTAALAGAAAHAVAAGKIIAVARGRAEFGPRALGARSVLSSPTSEDVRDEVNRRKGREAWRPLAPVVRVEDDTWFHGLLPSPHMIRTFNATDRARAEIPGGVHVDGSARVQTVGPNDDAFLRALLEALPAAGHPDVVLNTSLNRRGDPIADTAQQAFDAALAMKLDGLVLGNWYCTL